MEQLESHRRRVLSDSEKREFISYVKRRAKRG